MFDSDDMAKGDAQDQDDSNNDLGDKENDGHDNRSKDSGEDLRGEQNNGDGDHDDLMTNIETLIGMNKEMMMLLARKTTIANFMVIIITTKEKLNGDKNAEKKGEMKMKMIKTMMYKVQ